MSDGSRQHKSPPPFRSERLPGQYRRSWSEYLRFVGRQEKTQSLHDVLEYNNRLQTSPPILNQSLEALREQIESARGLPWVTPVLGSGCLNSHEPGESESASRIAAIEGALLDLEQRHPGVTAKAIAFIARLAEQRSGDEGADAPLGLLSEEEVLTSQAAARVGLAAALATSFYTTALNASVHVLERGDQEVVDVDLRGSLDYSETLDPDDFREDILSPLVAVLATFEEPGDDNAMKSLNELTVAMTIDLRDPDRPRIRRSHVELLTAFAWYFLTAGTTTYPGWSELLLFQAFEQPLSQSPEELDVRPSKSHVHDQAEKDWIENRFMAVTSRSWASRQSSATTATRRELFYDTIAGVIRQQEEIRRAYPDSPRFRLPLATAFVTSFDLELEMALWASSERPFAVIIPVYTIATNRGGRDASLHWIWTTITPDHSISSPEDALSIITNEAGSKEAAPQRWNRLTDQGFTSMPVGLTSLPIVVRLAGSPLMRVPEELDFAPGAVVHHALLLDEYSSLNQAALDTLSMGLPFSLTWAQKNFVPRFWMFFGTQLADSAIRSRLLAHQIASELNNGAPHDSSATGTASQRGSAQQSDVSGEGAGDPDSSSVARSGVVINERSRATDRELYHWQGFDVVRGIHIERIDDLQSVIDGVAQKSKPLFTAKERNA